LQTLTTRTNSCCSVDEILPFVPNRIRVSSGDASFELDGATEVTEPPLFKVLMHNDHYTTMDFVVEMLVSVFLKTPSAATEIMLAIHRRGEGLCGTFTHEVAESKIERVHSLARQSEFPLRCSMEEA
jgi:ATP-dependent Clp protease adaptor protein ClpS